MPTDTRVKICGVTSAEDRDAVVRAGADAVGFIVDVPVETPREIAPDTAAELVEGVPPLVTSVLVTMPADIEEAVTLQERVGADAVQVHSTLSPDELGTLHEQVDATLLVAVDADCEDIEAYSGVADALLVDSTGDKGGGGTGETHDWQQTRDRRRRLDIPILLAGGLTPDNVGEAVETVRPFGVDTASGVEQDGGTKDHEAVRTFVAAVRSAESTMYAR